MSRVKNRSKQEYEEKIIVFPASNDMTMVKMCGFADLPKRSSHNPPKVKENYGESYPVDPCIDYDAFIITYGFDEAIKSMLKGRTNEFTGSIMDYRFAIYHSVSPKLRPLRRLSKHWLALGRPVLAIFLEDFLDVEVQSHPAVFKAERKEDIDWGKVREILINKLGSTRGNTAYEYLSSEKYTGAHFAEEPFGLIAVLEIEEAIPLTPLLFMKVDGKPKRPSSWARTIRILEGEKAVKIYEMVHAADKIVKQGDVVALCKDWSTGTNISKTP